jgi:RepB plasmid partitioning protein
MPLHLVSTDDKAFTYNKRVNRLATVQEHKMILKAVERGVPEKRIAKPLNVDIPSIRRKRHLPDGMCVEFSEIFKDKHIATQTSSEFKKVAPLRQIEDRGTDGRHEQLYGTCKITCRRHTATAIGRGYQAEAPEGSDR